MVVETLRKENADFEFDFASMIILKMCTNAFLLYYILKLKTEDVNL